MLIENKKQIESNSAKDYIFGRCIGGDSYSLVYLAIDRHSGLEYAIKVFEKRLVRQEQQENTISRQCEAMWIMRNVPGFLQLRQTFQDQRSLYLVMQHARRGNLQGYISSFDGAACRHYAAEILVACEQLHQRQLIHGELKLQTVLLDEQLHIMLAEFGAAQKAELTAATDLRALGCIIYEMVAGWPAEQINLHDLPKDAQQLLKLLLNAPTKFVSYEQLRSEAFFTGIDWQTLRQQIPPLIYAQSSSSEFNASMQSLPNSEDLELALEQQPINCLPKAQPAHASCSIC
ncbi:3-phosphoinositide-dependent protein kinase 1-like [Drosophila busckii]|uniref:3-phosphoinositide-dependent protein kinase 1-like n=1 Tax=Drosophila busckii TaxID=30019 RepID=UPI0014333F8B|nr:3-phosphoinositide-dependent protein kinase 1-like [Drosophila busckii]